MLTVNRQKNMVLNIVFDQSNAEGLISYLEHICFDISAIVDVNELPAAILGHYRIKQGVYDVDRATMDLATYPPVAAAIVGRQADPPPLNWST